MSVVTAYVGAARRLRGTLRRTAVALAEASGGPEQYRARSFRGPRCARWGPRAELANDIAEAIVEANPQVRVRIAGGFAGISRQEAAQISWIGSSESLHAEMARASVAVVGGGVSLYEACAHGVAAVGVPVVAAQRPTVSAFVERGVGAGCHPWTRLSGIGCGRMCRTADVTRPCGDTRRAWASG